VRYAAPIFCQGLRGMPLPLPLKKTEKAALDSVQPSLLDINRLLRFYILFVVLFFKKSVFHFPKFFELIA
jgi:hypothetical protein